MIPTFPNFKKLEMSDKAEVEAVTGKFPVYSDFDFASLWAWDVKGEMEISMINGNLAIKFTDYLTGEPFFTYFGDKDTNDSADKLLTLSEQRGYGANLHLLPELSVQDLDLSRFSVEESRNNFDYVYDIERYLTFSGSALKSRRNFLNGFKAQYPHYAVVALDLSDPKVRNKITDLYRHWEENKGFISTSESFAYERLLESVHHFEHAAIGITIDGELVAFHISALPTGDYANGLFEKANINYHGIYQALMHEVAKELIGRGKKRLNYEQDLGIEGLRRAKMAFDPVAFLKKYSVSRKII